MGKLFWMFLFWVMVLLTLFTLFMVYCIYLEYETMPRFLWDELRKEQIEYLKAAFVTAIIALLAGWKAFKKE
ncbi:MAG: hypothetical protein QMD80_03600 [archaeon]|nr:hypothetical protein [archaeon]